MLKFLSTLIRVMFGFALACLAAGLVTVLFVTTPAEVLTQPFEQLPQTVGETFDLALLAATHLGIFASLFVLIVAVLSELFSIRSPAFYLFAGIAIAMLGFTAQYASEVSGQPTILNNYAIKAFLTIGFFGGFFYWLAAGQFAGHAEHPQRPVAEQEPVTAGAGTSQREDTEVVITTPPGSASPSTRSTPLLQKLRFSKPNARSKPSADEDETSRSVN